MVATTFSILWLKSKVATLNVQNVSIEKAEFAGYESDKKVEGIKIRSGSVSIYLLKIFFDDYKSIEKEILSATSLLKN